MHEFYLCELSEAVTGPINLNHKLLVTFTIGGRVWPHPFQLAVCIDHDPC